MDKTEPWWLRGLIEAMFTQAWLVSGRSAEGSNPDVAERKKRTEFLFARQLKRRGSKQVPYLMYLSW